MFADYHMHTEFSDDSILDMETVVLKAIDVGLDEICFTEHVDYGVKFGDMNCNYKAYRQKFEEMKKKYAHDINIKWGIEFGVQTQTIAHYQKDVEDYDFDFIILSVHQINNLTLHDQQYQQGKTRREAHRGYYHELYAVIKEYKDYSVLGHLDLMQRYDKDGLLPLEETKDLVEKVLRQVIKDGKGIEVNTSSFRYQVGDLTPGREILEMYYQLGGKIITVGSDTHRIDNVGVEIQKIYEILKEIGFEYHCTFDKMKPIYHKL